MMHLRVRGTGRPMVWLHAFPCSSAMWEGELAQFADRFQVIAPDLPGFGATPALSEPLTMAGAAQAVHKALRGHGVTGPIVLGGLSMGGYIAFEYLRAYPGEVSALILVATKASEDNAEAKAGRYKTIETVRTTGMEAFTRMFVPKVLGPTSLVSRPDVVTRVKTMIREASPESVMEGLRGLASRRDSLELLKTIRCPTLVVAGAEDKLIPLADHEVMREGIPGAALTVILEAGHLVNLEQPALFHHAVSQFLG